MKFWIPWSVSAVVAATFVVFFFIGLADGSVSTFNILLWIAMLAFCAGCVGGSLWLRSRGKGAASITLASVLAIPGLFALFLLLLAIILNPRWN